MLWILFLMATRQCLLLLFCSCRLSWHSGAGSISGEERGNRGAPGILSWHRCSQRQPGSMRGHPESIVLARQKLVLAAHVWAAGDIWSTHPHVKPCRVAMVFWGRQGQHTPGPPAAGALLPQRGLSPTVKRAPGAREIGKPFSLYPWGMHFTHPCW